LIKLITFLRRRPTLAFEDFARIWLEEHAPLAARFPGLRRYNVNLTTEPDGGAADALAELWFESRDSVQQAYATPIGREGSAHADAHTSRRQHVFVEEVILREAPSAPWKIVVAAKRLRDADSAPFARWLTDFVAEYAPRLRAASIAVATDTGGTVLNAGTAGDLVPHRREAVYDGALFLGFAAREDMAAEARSEPLAALVGELGQRSASMERLTLEEHRIV
jgi:uncharacterized protein (TIGR02118 family)